MHIINSHKQADKVAKELVAKYNSIYRSIKKEVFAFKSEFDLSEYNHQAAFNQDNLAYFTSTGRVMSNLDILLAKIENILDELAATEEDLFTNHLQKVYEQILDDKELMAQALALKWTGHNYQDNLKEHNRRLGVILRKEVYASLLREDPNKKMDALINKIIISGIKGSIKILNTETTYVNNTALVDLFKQQGHERYRYIANMDKKTCGICAGLHNSIFYLSDAKPGVNYPPMHTNCRCTIEVIK